MMGLRPPAEDAANGPKRREKSESVNLAFQEPILSKVFILFFIFEGTIEIIAWT
jgi:hypothetical protein